MPRRRKNPGVTAAVLLAFLCIGGFPSSWASDLAAINMAKLGGFFGEDSHIENFRHIDRIFSVKVVHRGEDEFRFRSVPRDLDALSYEWDDEKSTLGEFLEKTVTTGFLVVKDDTIIYERYFRGNTEDSLATSMSVAKSFASALVGIAIAEGHIESPSDPVTKYVAGLKGSGYDGVPIKHILQMSSGIDFTEVYDDLTSDTNLSDINVMMGRIGLGEPVRAYAGRLASRRASGEAFNYANINTIVLGFLIEDTTGKNPAAYLEEKIWKKLGMESNATWATDNHGSVLAFAWLNVTARDYARFGRLYLNKGNWDGEQVVPAAWVEASVKPDREYLKLKHLYEERWDIGYQFHWWIPEGREGEFTGIGIWGQYLYVNPAKNLIIVKNSVDPQFEKRDLETIAVFRAIGASLEE